MVPKKRVIVRLSAPELAAAKTLGFGSVSIGVRMGLYAAWEQKHGSTPMPGVVAKLEQPVEQEEEDPEELAARGEAIARRIMGLDND